MKPYRVEQSIQEYHRDKTFLSNSDLKHLAVWDRGKVAVWTPHEFYGRINGTIPPSKETREKRIGSAVHCAVLEPERFDKAFLPRADGRTKEGKAIKAENPFATFLAPEEYETASNTAGAILRSPLWPPNAEVYPEHVESCVRWCETVDIKLKCRPDAEFPEFDCDIKTTRCRTPHEWARDVVTFGYHRQAALYQRGLEFLRGHRRPFLFLVVCTEPPYSCWRCRLPEDAMHLGRSQNDRILDRLALYIGSGEWFEEWDTDEITLEIPHWGYPFEIPSEDEELVGLDA